MHAAVLLKCFVRLHRMHEMQPIAYDDPDICQSVSLSVMWLHYAMLNGSGSCLCEALKGPRNIVLDGGPDLPTARGKGKESGRKFHPLCNTGMADWITILFALWILGTQGTLCFMGSRSPDGKGGDSM